MADPLTILGALTGVTSLTMQTVDECIKGYKLYSDAVSMPEEFHYLGIRVQLQQRRFIQFGLQAGLLAKDGKLCHSLRINLSLLLSTLAEIKMIFEQYAAIEKKYQDGKSERFINLNDYRFESEPVALDAVLGTPFSDGTGTGEPRGTHFSGFRKAGKTVSTVARNLRQIVVEPRRIKWAALDKDAFESMTTKLEKLNSHLISLLDTAQIQRIEDAMIAAHQDILQLRDDIGGLVSLVKALTVNVDLPKNGVSSTIGPEDSFAVLVSQQQIEASEARDYYRWLAKVKIQHAMWDKLLNDAVTSKSPIASVGESSDLEKGTCLELAKFSFSEIRPRLAAGDLKQAATYERRNIWVEWKGIHSSQSSRAAISDEQIETRIILLAGFLSFKKPQDFRTPHCIGYVKQPSRSGSTHFGIVFDKPTPSSKLTTLRELLGTVPKPSLSSRMSLCATLGRFLYSFLSVNWLHKGLRSQNIIFFSEDSALPDLANPFVSGFGLSRPGSKPDLTEKPTFDRSEDIYRHPLAQSSEGESSYRKPYDVYSLGVIIVEIALWEPIEDAVGFKDLNKVQPSHLTAMRSLLLGTLPQAVDGKPIAGMPTIPPGRACADRVAAECGDVLQDVVKFCFKADQEDLESYRDEPDQEIVVRFMKAIRERILKNLNKVAAALQRE
ncbi:hypothetical protein EJ04DRAFT_556431 [Polyplosphaeria fusca]|uniref:Protein kinase domain-containing protein n=1 Tax=Polyplosphaeria fusca TaxID=682080 RepID=A0A9P4QKE8_9PLEO|nr:hypothetical protein EJ04DRAFT_556431 [Polyplosphaeria fusca]